MVTSETVPPSTGCDNATGTRVVTPTGDRVTAESKRLGNADGVFVGESDRARPISIGWVTGVGPGAAVKIIGVSRGSWVSPEPGTIGSVVVPGSGTKSVDLEGVGESVASLEGFDDGGLDAWSSTAVGSTVGLGNIVGDNVSVVLGLLDGEEVLTTGAKLVDGELLGMALGLSVRSARHWRAV